LLLQHWRSPPARLRRARRRAIDRSCSGRACVRGAPAADFNAGWYASRNAAFQHAVTQVSGIPLELDGDLLRYERGRPTAEPGSTELATRVLARRVGMSDADVRHDLELEKTAAFDRNRIYVQIFALGDRAAGTPLPRAVLPQIRLHSPKITRELTTDWFATRVERRFEACRARNAG
jgi:hypothetical protein